MTVCHQGVCMMCNDEGIAYPPKLKNAAVNNILIDHNTIPWYLQTLFMTQYHKNTQVFTLHISK